MGYETRSNVIRTFWPDDTEDEFWLSSDDDAITLEKIIELAQAKWGDIDFSQIRISSEFIHTDCLGYDLMDWGDYTHFLRISKEG